MLCLHPLRQFHRLHLVPSDQRDGNQCCPRFDGSVCVVGSSVRVFLSWLNVCLCARCVCGEVVLYREVFFVTSGSNCYVASLFSSFGTTEPSSCCFSAEFWASFGMAKSLFCEKCMCVFIRRCPQFAGNMFNNDTMTTTLTQNTTNHVSSVHILISLATVCYCLFCVSVDALC